LGVFPRWELFHLQPALPFVALALAQASKSRSRKVKTVALVLSVFVLLLFFRSSYLTWGKETRFYEKNVQEIVAYIQAKTLPKDRIYILNSWDSLYALSDRLPAPGILIPHLPWYLDQSEIQEKVVSGLKKNPAKLLVVNPPAAVGLGAYRPEKIWQTILKDYRKTDTVAGYDIYIQK